MDKLIVFVLSVTLLTFTIAIPPAFAEPVRNPENRHYYEYIESPDISWYAAAFFSEISEINGIGGHLATITSQDERDFVSSLITNNTQAWIGLYDSIDEGEHKWVTGERYKYSNWDINQPEEFHNDEDHSFLQGDNSKWSDVSNDHQHPTGYIIEYSPFHSPPQYMNIEYYNGSYYAFVPNENNWTYNDRIKSWEYRDNQAGHYWYDRMRGHLAVITSQEENDFVKSLLKGSGTPQAWIGLSDTEVEGELKWVKDEPFDYSNFRSGEINYDYEDYVYIQRDGYWNYAQNHDLPYPNTGYVIEFSP